MNRRTFTRRGISAALRAERNVWVVYVGPARLGEVYSQGINMWHAVYDGRDIGSGQRRSEAADLLVDEHQRLWGPLP